MLQPTATAWQRFLDTGPIALLPVRGGLANVVWTTTPAKVGATQTKWDLGRSVVHNLCLACASTNVRVLATDVAVRSVSSLARDAADAALCSRDDDDGLVVAGARRH